MAAVAGKSRLRAGPEPALSRAGAGPEPGPTPAAEELAGRAVDEKREQRYAARMSTAGKLELVIKINALPADVTSDANGWKLFALDCDGVRVAVRVRPKMWTKLEQAAASWPLWVAAIAGKMGQRSPEGFELVEPAIQVFERKPKPEAGSPSPAV